MSMLGARTTSKVGENAQEMEDALVKGPKHTHAALYVTSRLRLDININDA